MVRNILIYIFSKSNLRPPPSRKSKGGNGPTIPPLTVSSVLGPLAAHHFIRNRVNSILLLHLCPRNRAAETILFIREEMLFHNDSQSRYRPFDPPAILNDEILIAISPVFALLVLTGKDLKSMPIQVYLRR